VIYYCWQLELQPQLAIYQALKKVVNCLGNERETNCSAEGRKTTWFDS